MIIRPIFRSFIRFVVRLLADVEVQGIDNIPPPGVGVILASNHVGLLDAPLVFTVTPRPDATALVTDKYRHHPILRPIVWAGEGIWLNREGLDLNAMRLALETIRRGGLLGVAPEGTRSRTAALQPAKTGVAYLADKANCQVVPCAIWQTEGAVRKMFTLQHPQVFIRFGPPFSLPPVERATREADLRRNTDEVMLHIAAMLPPSYRGVYADHPRLQVVQANTRAE